jgi:NADPH:quinone reductase-like Zn-dependent oxidoreductase
MKAITYQNGDSRHPLKFEEIEKPTPDDDQVLIKVRAASLNPIDYHLIRHATMRRMMIALSKGKLKRPGRDVAGDVETVGRNVTRFKPGDAVLGMCGGAFAEYACVTSSALVMKPRNVSFEQAASIPLVGLTALQGLRDKGQVKAGQKVLVNGAAGGVGTFAVQIAHWLGALVTGVCSTRNVDRVRALGADQVIDYTREDFTQNGQRYDLLFDLVANHSFKTCLRALNPKGTYIGLGMVGRKMSVLGILANQVEVFLSSRFVSQKVVPFVAKISQEDLALLAELVETGRVTPVIDRTYPLRDVEPALEYLEKGHAHGKVVISLETTGSS